MNLKWGDENDGLVSIIEDLIACYGWMNMIFRANGIRFEDVLRDMMVKPRLHVQPRSSICIILAITRSFNVILMHDFCYMGLRSKEI